MKTKVYFNNSCSICRTEINVYKKHLRDEIEWVDISSAADFVNDTNKEKDELYRRMHIIDDGELITGAKTFLIIWKKIPKYKYLCKLFSNPIIFPVFNIFYEIIAFILYLKSKLFR